MAVQHLAKPIALVCLLAVTLPGCGPKEDEFYYRYRQFPNPEAWYVGTWTGVAIRQEGLPVAEITIQGDGSVIAAFFEKSNPSKRKVLLGKVTHQGASLVFTNGMLLEMDEFEDTLRLRASDDIALWRTLKRKPGTPGPKKKADDASGGG